MVAAAPAGSGPFRQRRIRAVRIAITRSKSASAARRAGRRLALGHASSFAAAGRCGLEIEQIENREAFERAASCDGVVARLVAARA